MKKSMRFSNAFGKFMFYFGNIIIGIIFVSPLIWMISASLKPEAKIFANMDSLTTFLPVQASLNNYAEVFSRLNMPLVFKNTLLYIALILVLDRNFTLYRAGSTVVGNYENSKAYQIQKVIMDVISYQMDVGIDKFRQVLKRTETDYLVLPVDLTNHDYIRQAGCTPVAQTEKYVVYRFEG